MLINSKKNCLKFSKEYFGIKTGNKQHNGFIWSLKRLTSNAIYLKYAVFYNQCYSQYLEPEVLKYKYKIYY